MTTRETAWPAGTPCWVDMAVVDVKGAQRFYGPLLDWKFVDTGARMGHYLLCTAGRRNAAALFRPMPGSDPLPWTVYLAATDATATLERVVEHGGTSVTEPLHIPGVGVMALAADPCGAVFGIWEEAGMIGFGVAEEPGAVASCHAQLADPAVGRAFYADVFGWTYGTSAGADGVHTILVEGRPVGTLGTAVDGGSRWLTSFAVDDLDAAARQVTATGGRVVDATAGVHADPDGVLFGLRRAGR